MSPVGNVTSLPSWTQLFVLLSDGVAVTPGDQIDAIRKTVPLPPVVVIAAVVTVVPVVVDALLCPPTAIAISRPR
jgi:hypothetical protein